MKDETFNKYKNSWLDFVKAKKITCAKEPTKEDFQEFFEERREMGLSGTTLRSQYSHLNKLYQLVYGRQLGDFKGYPLLDLVESFSRGEVIKKAAIFTKEEIERFLKEADDTNRWYLVRKVVAILAFCGGNRLHEIKALMCEDVQLSETGYVVTFKHAKQRKQVVSSQ